MSRKTDAGKKARAANKRRTDVYGHVTYDSAGAVEEVVEEVEVVEEEEDNEGE